MGMVPGVARMIRVVEHQVPFCGRHGAAGPVYTGLTTGEGGASVQSLAFWREFKKLNPQA
jgi:hypothetical protein